MSAKTLPPEIISIWSYILPLPKKLNLSEKVNILCIACHMMAVHEHSNYSIENVTSKKRLRFQVNFFHKQLEVVSKLFRSSQKKVLFGQVLCKN